MTIASRVGLAATATALLGACATDAPEPMLAVCRSEAAPEAGLRVNALSAGYFYADAPGGGQQGYALGGGTILLEPGDYVARLNDTRHPVTVESGRVTTCETTLVDVDGTTSEYWYLNDTLGTQLAYATLGQPLSVFPGSYRVRVNNTHAAAAGGPGDTVALATGSFVIDGATSEYFYVHDQNGQQLAYSTLGTPISLLPGSYRARVNNTFAPFTIEGARATTLRAGTVVATGSTSEYYYVDDTAGEQLAYAVIGQPTSYLPGSYSLRLNRRTTPVSVTAGGAADVATGTVVMEGPSGEYFYVLDEAGEQLAYSTMGTPISMLPGSYRVRVSGDTTAVTVVAGQRAAGKL